jgi:fluoride exporter
VTKLLLVCAGGALGSGARYLVATWAARTYGASFPRGTLIVNVTGSLLLGIVMGLAGGGRDPLSPEARLFLGAGIMGGFTTYSSFNYETLALAERGSVGLAAANVALTLAGCFAGGALGLVAGRVLSAWLSVAR